MYEYGEAHTIYCKQGTPSDRPTRLLSDNVPVCDMGTPERIKSGIWLKEIAAKKMKLNIRGFQYPQRLLPDIGVKTFSVCYVTGLRFGA